MSDETELIRLRQRYGQAKEALIDEKSDNDLLWIAVEAAQALADSNLVDHVGHGEFCPGGPSWREKWARDLHEALAPARNANR